MKNMDKGLTVKVRYNRKQIFWAIGSSKKRSADLFCLLFCFSQQTNQIHLFVFWKNLWRANPVFGFI